MNQSGRFRDGQFAPADTMREQLRWIIPLIILPFLIWGIYRISPKNGKVVATQDLSIFRDSKNKQLGFRDKKGKVIIPAQYNEARPFSEGLAPVADEGAWGFIDSTGKLVIPFQYDYTEGFSEQLAIVQKDSFWGYIDKKGILLIPCQYDEAASFDQGTAWVKTDDKEFYIDKKGNCVQDCPEEKELENKKSELLEQEKTTSNSTKPTKSKPLSTPGKEVSDPDNNVYKTVHLAGKTWLAENLKYKMADSWCYEEKEANCNQYGRLYTWQAAQKACKTLENGQWRVPSSKEWEKMINVFGGLRKAARSPTVYNALIKGGKSKLNVLLGGKYASSFSTKYMQLGNTGSYWSATAYNENLAWLYYFSFKEGRVGRVHYQKTDHNSCRCIKD